MRARWLLLGVCLPVLAMAKDGAVQPVKRAIKVCEQQHDASVCWALSQHYRQGKGVPRNHYNANSYALRACLYEQQLSVAKPYCEQAWRGMQNHSQAQCLERDIYHHLCELGSRASCRKMAVLAQRGWRGEKEVCWHQEQFGEGNPSLSLAAEYEKRALTAPFE